MRKKKGKKQMIKDMLRNSANYENISPYLKAAFDFLHEINADELPKGRVDIDGENLFAIVAEYETKDLENASYEGHEKYLDLHYYVSGEENVFYAPVDDMTETEDHMATDDYKLFVGTGDAMRMQPGEFVIFFPEDIHLPGISYKESKVVKKVILKIKCR